MQEGREGDWECSGCKNRNYAFRSFCNRCKQPRLLVDTKTSADSKWLPRIGDWICSGCTNNNYASREKCKKCGQPKEVAAMPAIAMHGASLPTYPHYFTSVEGVEQKMNFGLYVNAGPEHSFHLGSTWPVGGADKYGSLSASSWPFGVNQNSGLSYGNNSNQPLMVLKGWRNGDWMCNCGFHNYSSRAQCKKCNALMPPALGTKRLASEEPVHDWDNKRLNAGHTTGPQQLYSGLDHHQMEGSFCDQEIGSYAPCPSGSSVATSSLHVPMQFPLLPTTPTIIGKGAKQWREGDWMCTNCHNHNFASRWNCNRCKIQRDALSQPVSVV